MKPAAEFPEEGLGAGALIGASIITPRDSAEDLLSAKCCSSATTSTDVCFTFC